jgi:hypothetical protein
MTQKMPRNASLRALVSANLARRLLAEFVGRKYVLDPHGMLGDKQRIGA